MTDKPSPVHLGEAPDLSPGHNTFRILSLSGGGYRGLFTALILEDLERQAGKPLRQVFDLITGTSIGGILATGLSLEVPANDLVKALCTHGEQIFPKQRLKKARQLMTSLYAARPLEQAIRAILPHDHARNFASLPGDLLITAVSKTLGQPRLLGTGRFAGDGAGLTVTQALLATAAAPTYFPPLVYKGQSYIDGGLIANAPDLVALTETLNHTAHPLNDLWMLSIGTVAADIAEAGDPATTAMGAARWLTTQHLFDVTLTAQEQLAVSQAGQLLNNRYLRIDPKPSQKQAKVIGLDRADEVATNTLRQLAEEAIRSTRDTNGQLLGRLLH